MTGVSFCGREKAGWGGKGKGWATNTVTSKMRVIDAIEV